MKTFIKILLDVIFIMLELIAYLCLGILTVMEILAAVLITPWFWITLLLLPIEIAIIVWLFRGC